MLTKHLEYLVEHPDVWERMGRAGREHVEQEYDVRVQVGELEMTYAKFMRMIQQRLQCSTRYVGDNGEVYL